MACAMPHAMERSVATPTMKARLPARNPMVRASRRGLCRKWRRQGRKPLVAGRVQTDAQLLPGVQPRVRGEAIPAEQLRHAALEEPREMGAGVPPAPRAEKPPLRAGAPRSAG